MVPLPKPSILLLGAVCMVFVLHYDVVTMGEQIEKSYWGNVFINLPNWLKPSGVFQLERDFMWHDFPLCKCRMYGAQVPWCCALFKFCCPEPKRMIPYDMRPGHKPDSPTPDDDTAGDVSKEKDSATKKPKLTPTGDNKEKKES